jgi:hypothetical protein
MHSIPYKPFILVSLVLLLLGLPLATAQDDNLTEEEKLALANQVLTAFGEINAYESFVYSEGRTDINHTQVYQGETLLRDVSESEETTGEAAIIRGDTPSGLYTATTKFSSFTPESQLYAFTVEAEFIYAEGTLYGRATVTEGETEFAVPAEFTDLSGEEFAEFADRFDTSDFVNEVLGIEAEGDPLSNPELVLDTFSDATYRQQTIEEKPVDRIDMSFRLPNLAAFLANDPDTPQAMLDNMTEESGIWFTMQIFEGGPVLALQSQILFKVTAVPGQALDPSLPEDITVNLDIFSIETNELSQINEKLEPITAPE